MNRYLKISLAALAISASPYAYAASVTLQNGYLGGYDTNSNGANHVQSFADLSIGQVVIDDGNAGATFQGNDTTVTVTVYGSDDTTVLAVYDGAINWTHKVQGIARGIGFVPSSLVSGTAIPYTFVTDKTAAGNTGGSDDANLNFVLEVRTITPQTQDTAGHLMIPGSADQNAITELNAFLAGAPAAPVIKASDNTSNPASAISVDENQTGVMQLGSTYTGTGPIKWKINTDAGDDSDKFDIDPVTGVITFKAAPDYENPTDGNTNNTYILTVIAYDDSNPAILTTHQVTVTVLDLDETAPLITGPSNGEGAEESGITIPEGNTDITTLTANEGSVKWYLDSGSDKLKFAIDEDTGKLTFLVAPDYENPADSDHNNTYVVVVKVVDAAGNEAFQTVTVTITNVDEIARKLAEIGGKLRSGLRGYAVHGLSDMLSFNESLMRDNGDEGCASPKAAKELSGRINANASGANVDVNYSKQLTDCARPHKLLADAGFTYSKVAGNWNSRLFGSLRFETKLDQDVTLGAGLMGSLADDQITGFENSKISDKSLQFNVYARYRITDTLRAGAFAGLGRAWYDFGLTESDGFVLDGEMTGKRHTFGGMLSGDITVGGTTLTTDAIVSRAVEKLGNATLAAQYLGEDRSGIAFAVGTVDVTRISVPVSAPFQLTGEEGDATDGNGSWSRLVLSPGLLCEDNNVDSSALRCGYQLGARLTAGDGGRSRYYVSYNWESVADMRRSLVGVGYAYRFGRNLELALELNRGLGNTFAMASTGAVGGLRTGGLSQGNRAMLNVRIAQ